MINRNFIKHTTTLAILLSFLVILLGAYTRLTNAGLSCPDWPGCYGRMLLPGAQSKLNALQAAYPTFPLEIKKAWTEMIHRYLAGFLGLLILTITLSSLMREKLMPKKLSLFLIVLLAWQALLGKWTVTLKLLPIVVMAHLLSGMTIFACLILARCYQSQDRDNVTDNLRIRMNQDYSWLIIIGIIILFMQLALGGWVSANYAGLACIGFPACNGHWWPSLNFTHGFYLFSPVGLNYQGGVLDHQARMTIQIIHRLGAGFTFVYLGGLCLWLRYQYKNKFLGGYLLIQLIFLLLVGQICLGIANVVYWLPLGVAVAHNGVGALLLAALFMLYFINKKSYVGI